VVVACVVSLKLAPGLFLAFIVKATDGLVAVEPLNVMSGITCFKNKNLSPSPISIGADSIKKSWHYHHHQTLIHGYIIKMNLLP
jgi:hypothetical protein